MARFALLFLATVFTGYAQAQAPRVAVEGKNGMVVAVSPPAVDVGVAILKAGGNAVDAAVAVALAEAVTWPEAGNIGGGGFMMVWPKNGQAPVMFDYREMAPTTATADMFADGKTTWASPKAVGIPGTIRGLALAHSRFGKLPWKSLVEPAVKLAGEGFAMTPSLARRLNGVLTDTKTTNAEFIRVLGKNGTREPWAGGDILKQHDLAKTLKAVAEKGPDAFYTGENAELMAKEMAATGGLITVADMNGYKAAERTPLKGTYRGHEIYGPAPPSSGGVAVIEALNILETFDLKAHARYSQETTHLLAEASRRAFADRAKYLGDPDFVTLPTFLLEKAYATKLAKGIAMDKATLSETLAGDVPLVDKPESENTTHFSVIDKDGMAVSQTYTLENAFGSRIVVRGGGYVLNNEMTDFNTKPGVTSRTGSIGTLPNQVAPGKRMLSSMTPVLVAKDGKLLLVTGSPGGRTIINTSLCMVVNIVDYDMPIQAAVDAPRQHHQWFPDRIQMEGGPEFDTLSTALKAKGHIVQKVRQGDAHSIRVDPKTGVYHGAADNRLDGKAAGY